MSTEAAATPQTIFASQKKKIDKPSKGNVLLVEDEADLRTLLSYHLKKENYTVLAAEDGQIACDLIDQQRPHLVLLDILMPKLDGWEVCRKIRTHEDKLISSIPIIMLTALRDEKDKFKGLQLGADAFINKPYSLKEVLLHCHNFVQSRKKHLALIQERECGTFSPKKSIYQLLFHEMKNHLTIIEGMARLLNRSKSLEPKEKEFSATIEKSAQYLEMIVHDIRLFEQIEGKNLDVPADHFDLHAVIGDLVEMFRPAAQEKHIDIELKLDGSKHFVNLNKTALKIVLATIFENALKYCYSGSTIEVASRKTGQTISLSISDNGPGIREEEQTKIFDKHYRVKDEDFRKPGSGLGLYFAKILTEVMNGTITVESSPGKGTKFTASFKEYNEKIN